MTENLLLDALRERLSDALKDIYHPTDDSRGRDPEVYRAPIIVDGYLPPKRSKDREDFPFVIVRPSEWDSVEMEGGYVFDILTVKLLIGSYGAGSDDYKYAVNIFRRIINDLRSKPCLNDTWKMAKKIKAKMPDEQAEPIWFIEALISFELPTPQENEQDDGYAV